MRFVWQKVFNNLEGIDNLAAMAAIYKNFYKWINRDFKEMCYQEGIYRFKGEYWATAFSLTSYRAFDLIGYSVINCPNSGKIVFFLTPTPCHYFSY
ncbi:unnamed protein product [Bursaphelenchus okinawaensis]|uniref:Uncharacterized protein n=1 Tax=Bursaphelenchus okinawaensis TaxID=465554 RepID=A0A811LR41_9BILA|nr:unnamed protein product [Bursaphelenchus okinawaensis]CAG9126361.1 unnamed protein product [Bursaphelenchus okinawaensis]